MDYLFTRSFVIILSTGFSASMAKMLNLFVGLLSLTTVTPSTSTRKAPTVQVRNGTLEGFHSSTYGQDFFLGVPYAQPPVGNLRFRQAQSLNTSWDGVREAKEFQNFCVGYGVGPILPQWSPFQLNHTARPNIL